MIKSVARSDRGIYQCMAESWVGHGDDDTNGGRLLFRAQAEAVLELGGE